MRNAKLRDSSLFIHHFRIDQFNLYYTLDFIDWVDRLKNRRNGSDIEIMVNGEW